MKPILFLTGVGSLLNPFLPSGTDFSLPPSDFFLVSFLNLEPDSTEPSVLTLRYLSIFVPVRFPVPYFFSAIGSPAATLAAFFLIFLTCDISFDKVPGRSLR